MVSRTVPTNLSPALTPTFSIQQDAMILRFLEKKRSWSGQSFPLFWSFQVLVMLLDSFAKSSFCLFFQRIFLPFCYSLKPTGVFQHNSLSQNCFLVGGRTQSNIQSWQLQVVLNGLQCGQIIQANLRKNKGKGKKHQARQQTLDSAFWPRLSFFTKSGFVKPNDNTCCMVKISTLLAVSYIVNRGTAPSKKRMALSTPTAGLRCTRCRFALYTLYVCPSPYLTQPDISKKKKQQSCMMRIFPKGLMEKERRECAKIVTIL